MAHHVSFMRPYGLFDVAAVSLANSLTLYPYVDSISDKLDFIGINYYGQVSSPLLASKLTVFCCHLLYIEQDESTVTLIFCPSGSGVWCWTEASRD